MKSLLVLLGRTRWAAFVLLMCNTSFAQYSIDWITVHGGEGTTSSGVYENSGTIGQPDAGSVIAGEFVIGGGYWSDLEAVLQPGAAGLSIEELSPDSALITWPAPSTGYVLQENANLTTSNWLAVTNPPAVVNGEMQITASPTVGNRYCRLNYQP